MPAETRARDAVSVKNQLLATALDPAYEDRELSRDEKHLVHAALTNTPMPGVNGTTSVQTFGELVKALAFLSDAYSDSLHKQYVAQAELAALESDIAATRRVLGFLS